MSKNTEHDELSKDDSPDISSPKRSLLWWVLPGVGALLVLGIAGAGWYFLRSSNGAGQPVAAPRESAFTKSTLEIPAGEQSLALTEDQLKAADLEIVKVGESLDPSAANATSTGVVRANEYEETPVLSQVSGVVKSIDANLGRYVRKGQTVAVISSEELARVQSDYLSKRADLLEARKRYRRSLDLVEISDESRKAVDGAVANLKAIEAKMVETKANLIRSQKLEKIGAISKRELELAVTANETAIAKHVEAKSRLDRNRRLLKVNPARKNEIDSFLTRVTKTESETSAVRQRLLVLGMSADRIARLNSPRDISSELRIVSPVSGSVTERFANTGEVIATNAKLISVTDLSTVWVIAQVFEKDLGKITVGSGASVSSDAFPGEYFRGNVSYVDPQLDETTRTAKVRVELANPGEKFKIGMFVRVALATVGGTETTNALVPEKAIQEIGERRVVFESTGDPKRFVIRTIEALEAKDGMVPIKKGIFVGDRIVSEGSFLLRAEWLKTNADQ